ncbi:hypothetical protein WJX72_012425 [[Myrmecia] bisecta]|uniref:Histone H2A n=1 Tax=[Myrmecia] bisecta TaxID=41462 RepID=A0AAW1QT94_9CHLO
MARAEASSTLQQLQDLAACLYLRSLAKHARLRLAESSAALDDLIERLAKECKHLVQSNDRATLTARDVEAARLCPLHPGRP